MISNIKAFKNSQKLKKAVLTFIATQLSEVETEKFKKIFLQLDQNCDGSISF